MNTALTRDARHGMAWWNGLNELQRLQWMERAGNTGVAADAWLVFKRSHPDYGTPNWCPTCSPKNIGYCRCDPACNE